VGERFAAALGTDVHHWIPEAGHFLQEDAGAAIGGHVARWLTAG
jgi:pimeloyl-ACP methyl ester carboxylesterase